SVSVPTSTSVASALTRRSSAAREASAGVNAASPGELTISSGSSFRFSMTVSARDALHITYEGTAQKEGPREAGLRTIHWPKRSGSLVVDLGEVILGGLRTVGNELAEIFGGRLGPGDKHFAARTGEV